MFLNTLDQYIYTFFISLTDYITPSDFYYIQKYNNNNVLDRKKRPIFHLHLYTYCVCAIELKSRVQKCRKFFAKNINVISSATTVRMTCVWHAIYTTRLLWGGQYQYVSCGGGGIGP